MTAPSTRRESAGEEVSVFDASPALRHPRQFLADVRRDLRVTMDLAPQMARRQIVARYRRSVLGYLWLLLVPVSTAAAWLFVRASGALHMTSSGAPYPLYIVAGLFLWQGFLRALNAPLQQVNASRAVISKIRSPWEAVIAAGWVETVFEFAIFVLVLLLAIPLLGEWPGLGMLSAVVPIVALLLLGAALGLLLVPLGLLFDDIPRAVVVGSTFLFFVTPIVYRPPSSALGTVTFRLNPVAVLLDAARSALVGDAPVAPALVLPWALVALLAFVVGWIAMRVAVPHLVARL
ncbi:MAG: ABC transporter permease [Gemmatimonadetes bacterium]|nr:ABC transporter permease [Gemmatimonadota bacterium]